MRGVDDRSGRVAVVAAAQADIVAVEGDVDVAEWDRLADELGDVIAQPCGERMTIAAGS